MTKIFEGSYYLLIHTGYSDPLEHRHMAAHIIITMDGEMTVYSGDRSLSCRGVMIPSGTDHRVDTHGSAALVFLFDCTSSIAKKITDICSIQEQMCHGISNWYALLAAQEDKVDTDFENMLLTVLEVSTCNSTVKDDRILQAMDYIRKMFSDKITCRQVAEYVHLSQSRFSHLFKQETGMSFACYVISQRLMYAYSQVFRGKSITEAALDAGFSGSSHLADVNRRVFGMSVRSLKENVSFCRVS